MLSTAVTAANPIFRAVFMAASILPEGGDVPARHSPEPGACGGPRRWLRNMQCKELQASRAVAQHVPNSRRQDTPKIGGPAPSPSVSGDSPLAGDPYDVPVAAQ
jgi:hypothetical protein